MMHYLEYEIGLTPICFTDADLLIPAYTRLKLTHVLTMYAPTRFWSEVSYKSVYFIETPAMKRITLQYYWICSLFELQDILYITSTNMVVTLHRKLAPARICCNSCCAQEHNNELIHDVRQCWLYSSGNLTSQCGDFFF
jgi:hypothetical protein